MAFMWLDFESDKPRIDSNDDWTVTKIKRKNQTQNNITSNIHPWQPVQNFSYKQKLKIIPAT